MIFRILPALLLALALAVAPLAPLLAQAPPTAAAEAAPIDYEVWRTEATRAENLIAAGTASTAFLTNLRSTLVGWRARFLAAQSANDSRIQTVQAQITALGPPPAEGETEPDAIAQRRAELSAQLAEAQVPRVTATEAFNRANGLVGEIDTILAERQARALLERDPAPVNPLNWGTALAALADVALGVDREIQAKIADHRRLDESLWDRLPFAAVLSLIALGLLTRSRMLVGRWTDRMQRQVSKRRGRMTLAFVVSLLQVLLPIIGLILLGVSVTSLDILGRDGNALMAAGIEAFVSIYLALWLGGRLLNRNNERG